VALAGGNIKQVYYCVHLPSDHCSCRKPQPGAIHRAQLDYAFDPKTTYFVGDSPSDLQAASAAGCPGILVRRDAFLEPPALGRAMPLVVSSLYEAAAAIVAEPESKDTWTETARAASVSSLLMVH
jgi:D-glycero-D-manno-heptose 1,7-bisphosphate phosphatase